MRIENGRAGRLKSLGTHVYADEMVRVELNIKERSAAGDFYTVGQSGDARGLRMAERCRKKRSKKSKAKKVQDQAAAGSMHGNQFFTSVLCAIQLLAVCMLIR